MKAQNRGIIIIRVTLCVSLISFGLLFSINLIKSNYENFVVAILQQTEPPHKGSYSVISPWAWLYRTDNNSAYLQDMVNAHLGSYQEHELLSWTIDHDKLLDGDFLMEFFFRVKHSKEESLEHFSIAGYFHPKVSFHHVYIDE